MLPRLKLMYFVWGARIVTEDGTISLLLANWKVMGG